MNRAFILLLAILLLAAGCSNSNESVNKSEISHDDTQQVKNNPKEQETEKTSREEKLNDTELANSITEDDIEDFSSEGDIYMVQQKDKSKVILQHNNLGYQIELDSDDYSKLLIEENEEDNIISTGFYYEANGTKAFVFSIDNYASFVWDDYKDIVNEELGKTPIRVLTYSIAQDNPFPPSSKESDEFLRLIEKAPGYAKTFKFVNQKK